MTEIGIQLISLDACLVSELPRNHEIGHNYDGEIRQDLWSQFLALSGWSQPRFVKSSMYAGQHFDGGDFENKGWYRTTNNRQEFARGYGGTNAYEDWATTWELYFNQNRSTRASNPVLTAKLKLVDRMVRGV